MKFKVISKYKPSGDQPDSIDLISKSIAKGNKYQTVKGATGTGKTYVMSKIIEKANRPAIVLSHNKTLAAQLFKELKLLESIKGFCETDSRSA